VHLRRPHLVALFRVALCFTTGLSVAQVADFSADVTAGCFPLTVNFTDTSTGSPTTWAWDFGNGNSSPLQNPSAVYSSPGTYTVSLKASKGATSNTKTSIAYIQVYGPPDVDFSFDINTGCAPLSVNFDDQTTATSGTLANWFWTFGDGGTSQATNPTHIFEKPGPMSISLKVRNQYGCEQTKVVDAAIVVKGPITEFTLSSPAICSLPATFSFTNTTSGEGALNYQWDFGDGQASSEVNPNHTYNIAGSYDVMLTTRDASGCSISTRHKIYAGSDDGVDFTTSPSPVCPGQEITFSSVSADPIASYDWTFSNGSTSTLINPKTSYVEPGVYQVTLSAQLLNHACASVITKTIEIIEPAAPSFDKYLDCDLNLRLANTSSGSTRVEWYINDVLMSTSIKFSSPIHLPGNQIVKLIAYNAAGCAYEKTETVTLMKTPVARFTPNIMYTCKPGIPTTAGCAPFSVNFVNGSTANAATAYIWDFGDGNTSTQLNPTHVFTTKGIFEVKLTAYNPNGCSTEAKAIFKVSDTMPNADFEVNKTIACPGEPITFTNKSLNAESWCWDFGDGWITEGKDVVHGYGGPGTYTVTLTAKNGCQDVLVRTNLITIKNPLITFSFVKTCEDPFNVQLTNLSANFDELEWNFGDGQTSTTYDVGSHHYASEGDYQLTLTGTNHASGCTSTAILPLTIQKVNADFSVNTTKPCVGVPLTFTDQSHAAVKWSWKLGPFTSNQRNFGETLFTPGNYTALLEVKDSDSCVAKKELPIDVINMKGDFSFTATSTCNNLIVDFQDGSTGTPAPTTWLWEFGDGFTSVDRNPVHAYSQPGEHTIVLTISNSEGSCAFTKERAVDFRIPIPDFAVEPGKFCLGETIILANTSANASLFKWFFGDGRSSDSQSAQISYDEPGNYTITLFAKDEYGCELRTVKQAFITVVKPVADFSVDNTTGSCPPFTATFQDMSASEITQWKWTFGDGKESTLQSPVNIYATAGIFNVSLNVTDAYGCTASKEVSQFVKVGGPSGSFNAQGAGSCTSQTVTFSASVLNTSKMTWDFGDGVVMNKTEPTLTHEYNSTGSFTPSLLLTDANNCTVLALGPGEIMIRDTTDITATVSPECVFQNDPLSLSADTESADGVTWVWAIDGIAVGNIEDLTIAITEAGVHEIKVVALNDLGCQSEVSTTVHVQGDIAVIPNVITPNGDKWNQTFDFSGLEHSEWDINIVDRWGKTVYEEKNYKGTWDAGGQSAGVYYYVLQNTLCKDLDYKGVISVVR
jgi:gliding motility-associated-like protein